MPDNPAIQIAGVARSLAELRFAADLRACERCGAREPAGWRMLSYDSRWQVSAACRRCRAARRYVMHAGGDLLGARTAYLELGGPEPSTVITAAELAADIERLAPDVTLDPAAARDGAGAEQNMARYERLRTTLTELAKFIPAGAGEVPGLAGREPGPVVPHARPARYTRDWISGELAYWQPLGLRLPRIAPEPRPGPPAARAAGAGAGRRPPRLAAPGPGRPRPPGAGRRRPAAGPAVGQGPHGQPVGADAGRPGRPSPRPAAGLRADRRRPQPVGPR